MSRSYRVDPNLGPPSPRGLQRSTVYGLIAVVLVIAAVSVGGAVWLAVRSPSPVAQVTTSPPPVSTTHARTRVVKLRDHPLLNNPHLMMHPVPCALTPWAPTAVAEITFASDLVDCLNSAWKPVFEEAHLPLAPAHLSVHYGTDYGTACVPQLSETSLCNDSIHVLYQDHGSSSLESFPGATVALISGWFGEYVQAQSGIATAYRDAKGKLEQNASSRGEFSRRHTLQWQCFSGVFVGAEATEGVFPADVLDQALDNTRTYSDEEGAQSVNGSALSHRHWFERGAHSQSLSECNTWAAPDREVL